MRKIYIIIFIILIVIIYLLGSVNIYLGSNSMLFNTSFDYSDTIWKCKKYDIYAKTQSQTLSEIEKKYMIVIDNKENKLLYLFPRGNKLVDVYYYSDSLDTDEKQFVCTVQAKYKKRFGKIYKFEILGLDNSSILNYGKRLHFKRVSRGRFS